MKYLKPSFFIIGERKCGTSSLYRYLLHHPQVLPCQLKEPSFFTQKPWKIGWNIQKYYQLFPTVASEGNIRFKWPELDAQGNLYEEWIEVPREASGHYITGEASADTYYYAHPRILKYFLPNIRLILMLRHPVDRLYSHYRMWERFKQNGQKTPPITSFIPDMKEDMARYKKGQKPLFLGPSLYIKTLPRWLKTFGEENIYILRMEDLAEPNLANQRMQELCSFLELDTFSFEDILQQRYNQAPPGELHASIRTELGAFFKESVQELEQLLHKSFNWPL